MSMTGTIPHLKAPGGKLLFKIDTIRQWVENGGVVSEGGK